MSKYDKIEVVESGFVEIETVEKYNHNHGPDGRFVSGGVGSSSGSAKWHYPGIVSATSKIESYVANVKTSAQAATAHKAIKEQEKVIERAISDIENGVEDGDMKVLLTQRRKLRMAQKKLMQNQPLGKSASGYVDQIEVVEKFNPFHDELGRFATSQGFKTYSANPHSKAGQKAISRSYAGGHNTTINSHANAKGTSIGQNMYWLNNGGAKAVVEPGKKQPKSKKPKDNVTDDKKLGAKQTSHRPEKKLDGYEAEKVVMKDTGVDKATAKKMVESVKAYSGSYYDDIRSYQANGKPPSAKDKADAIEDFIAKSPKWDGGPLYRGIDIDKNTAEAIIAGIKSGKAISQNGMSSWSTKKDVAESFAHTYGGSYNASIIFKTSSAKSGTSIKHLSKFPNEAEVIVSSKATWKATKVTETTNNGRTIYTVECEEV